MFINHLLPLRYNTWICCNWDSKIHKPRNLPSRISQNIDLLIFRTERSHSSYNEEREAQMGQMSHPKSHSWLMAEPGPRWVSLNYWFSNFTYQKSLIPNKDPRTPFQTIHYESVEEVSGNLYLTTRSICSLDHTKELFTVFRCVICITEWAQSNSFTLKWERRSKQENTVDTIHWER